MKILTYGEIMERGSSAFTAVAQLDDNRLTFKTTGSVRVENPYRHLSHFLEELQEKLAQQPIAEAVIDFTELKYCNSVGFYVIMDIIEAIYDAVEGMIAIRRLQDDDWQQESLPILLNLEDEGVKKRTIVEEVQEI
jgi:hypothetical protein